MPPVIPVRVPQCVHFYLHMCVAKIERTARQVRWVSNLRTLLPTASGQDEFSGRGNLCDFHPEVERHSSPPGNTRQYSTEAGLFLPSHRDKTERSSLQDTAFIRFHPWVRDYFVSGPEIALFAGPKPGFYRHSTGR